jgi:hypothetical protein
VENCLAVGLVVVGVGANEVDDLAIAIGRLAVIASGLVDQAAGGAGADEKAADAAQVGELYRQIGQLKVENDFLSKRLGR